MNVAEVGASAEAKDTILVVPNAIRDGETPANTNRHHQKPAKARRKPHTHTFHMVVDVMTPAAVYQRITPRNAEVTSRVIAAEQLNRDTKQRRIHIAVNVMLAAERQRPATERQRPATERKINTDISEKNKQQHIRQQHQQAAAATARAIAVEQLDDDQPTHPFIYKTIQNGHDDDTQSERILSEDGIGSDNDGK